MLDVIFLPPEESTHHAKNMSVVNDVYKFGQEILHNWHFLEFFVQITKSNSSQSCIMYNFAAWKKLFAACTKKFHPDDNFLQYAKI